MMRLTLTLKMTTAQVVKTSVTVNNSPIQDYVHSDDQTQPTFEMTPGFKPFTVLRGVTVGLISTHPVTALKKNTMSRYSCQYVRGSRFN